MNKYVSYDNFVYLKRNMVRCLLCTNSLFLCCSIKDKNNGIINKIASKPRDDDHHLGHGKAEYIYSMLISITMILLSLKVFIDSGLTIINKTTYKFSFLLIIVCIINIIVKLFLYLYTKRIYIAIRIIREVPIEILSTQHLKKLSSKLFKSKLSLLII